MEPTSDDLVREIAARDAIRDLSARYCDCIWRKDVDGLVSLFTEDGIFRVEGLEVEASSHGRAQLRKMYEKALEELDPRLFVHSQIIDLVGANHATGRCYVELFSAKYGMERVGLGYYEDQYTKVGDKWKFASRRYFLDTIDTAVSLRRTFMV
jgi:ketosteroid isomerase-like protein